MRQGIETVTPDGSAVGLLERNLETLAVLLQAILFTGERCDSADGASSFAGQLRGFFVCFLVGLVLEDDDLLEKEAVIRLVRESAMFQAKTYKTNVTSGQQKRGAGCRIIVSATGRKGYTDDRTNSDESELPDPDKANNGTSNDSCERLDNSTKRHTSQAVHLLRVFAKVGSQGTGLERINTTPIRRLRK